MTLCKRYVDNFEKMVRENIGILFTGDVGRGKTFVAACIANALINQGHRVLMTNFSQIINDMMDFSTGNNNEYIQQLNNYELLVIDDFGVERKTQTALQYMEDVIDSRYTSKKPIIITTNLSTKEIDDPHDVVFKRMCSRIKGMTITFSVNGSDKRSELKKDKLSKFKTMLGG
jgi:DNA replication protein DnaC